MGVRRAIQLTEKIIDSETPRPVYTLGPLIHNKLVLERLKGKGVIEAAGPEEVEEGTVIIRAHGVPPDVMEALKKKSVKIVDATCTRVIASMRNAGSCGRKGYHVLFVGDEDHGEIKAIAGYAESYSVIAPDDDIDSLTLPEKTVIIGQTTLREADYNSICGELQKRYPRIKIINSICPATEKRQEALQELIEEVDAMVVIGGKNSANTKRLYETAKQQIDAAWHVETPENLPGHIGEFVSVGITAGASTPDWIIESIEERIRSLW